MSRRLAFERTVGFALIFVGLTAPLASYGQEPVIPRPAPETHALDSLLGKWTFVEESHDTRFPPKVNGAWTFSRSADGFMVVDEFRAFNRSRETVLLGETYRVYNPAKKMWTFQGTIFQSPIVGPKNGEWDAGITTFQEGQIIDEVTNGKTITRARIFNIKPDTFSCVFERSNDGGQTWGTPVNLEAVRLRE